jgi:hypothetical protein
MSSDRAEVAERISQRDFVEVLEGEDLQIL